MWYCLFNVFAFCSYVIAMVPPCDFSLLIVGLVLVLDLLNFQNDLGFYQTLVTMILSKVALASLMRLVVWLHMVLIFKCWSLSFVK